MCFPGRKLDAERGCDRSPRLCRDPACGFPPERRPADRGRVSRRCARRRLDRDRHGSHPVLRSDAGEDHCRGRRPPGGDRETSGSRLPRRRSPGSRPTSTIFAPSPLPICFHSGKVATTALRDFAFVPDVIEVLAPGAQSSLQELPGRLGLWHVGVPPSGPMDERSFRLANRLVGNADDNRALELTVSGPTLRFYTDTVIALGGAQMPMTSMVSVAAQHGRRQFAPGQCCRSARSTAPASAPISPSRRLRRSADVRLTRHLRARPVWRPRHRRAQGRRCAAPRTARACQAAGTCE